jgi:hypothetical protein
LLLALLREAVEEEPLELEQEAKRTAAARAAIRRGLRMSSPFSGKIV